MSRPFDAFGGVDVPKMSDFWSWVHKAFTPSYQDEVEMYLKDSVDHKDLQARMDNLMRRGLI
jgi:hypothetical protein